MIDKYKELRELEPKAWLVTNGRLFRDRAFISLEGAAKSIFDRNDGSQAKELSPVDLDLITALLAERDALLADAERYRFIRGKIGYDRYGVSLPCGNTKVQAGDTDRAIDAAIEAAKRQEGLE